jgi:phospholipase/carboxylesterase
MLETDFIPAREKDSRRLMIVLHGLGDSMEGYRFLPEALDLPRMNHLLVNAPDPYYGGYSWYDFAGDPTPGVQRSRRELTALIDGQADRGFAADQITLFGFSQGSLMVVDTALRYPKKLAGVVGISGYVHQPDLLLRELSPVAREQRLLITHGTHDPLIPFAQVREQINLLKAAQLKIEWHEFVKVHTIAGEDELEVIRRFVRAGYPD